jgi:hypothetical protein
MYLQIPSTYLHFVYEGKMNDEIKSLIDNVCEGDELTMLVIDPK